MESSQLLLEKISEELEMLESIFSEDHVVHEKATLDKEAATRGSVSATFKLTPNTGFN